MHILKLSLITIFLVFNAFAQESDTPSLQSSIYELPDLIVTGTLWDAPIKNVAESVTLFSSTSIKDREAIYFQDLANAIPNLTLTGGNNRSRYFQIRGLGENSQFEGETPDISVRFLIDDFDFTGIGGVASLFDVKQVEVIRGAQISAYGVNASAGIIKLSTQEVTGEKSSKSTLSIGTKNQRSLGYATGGILGEETSSRTNYRLSIFQNNTDGFIENENLNRSDTNKSSEFFSLLKLKHNLSNDSSILTSFVYADAKGGYDQWSLDNNRLKTITDNPGEDNQRSKGISIRMNSNNDKNFSLTSITTLLNTDSLYSYDVDWGNYVKYDDHIIDKEVSNSGFDGFLSTIRDRKSISQEVRLDSPKNQNSNSPLSQWTTGVHFNKLSESTKVDFFDSLEEEDQLINVLSEYENQSVSLFGKADYKLSQNSKLIFGLRYEHQKVEFISETLNNGKYGWAAPPDYMVLGNGGKVSTDDDLFGGSITYQNKLNDSYTIFLSYNKGYKGSGANTTSFKLYYNEKPEIFDTEKINNFELGLSYINPENTYSSKFNVFYLTRNNAQLRDSDGSGGWFNYYTQNKGNAKHYGAEYNSIWNFLPGWTLENNISLLKAELDGLNRVDLNNELSNSPSYKYSSLLKYSSTNGFYSNISINGSDEYYEENGHHLKREAYSVVNASIGYAKNQWDISLWVKNLFDHDYTQRVFYFNNYDPEYGGKNALDPRFYKTAADPLNYGVSMNYIW